MNKKKYINEVVANLNCSRMNKKKIKKDLESDINLSLENGENWDEIKNRLGNPKDFAKELNENFDYSPKNSKNNLVIGILIGAISIVFILFLIFDYFTPKTNTISNSTIFNENSLENKVTEVIKYINENDYKQISRISNDIMKKELTENQLTNAIQNLGNLGEYKRITNSTYYEVKSKGEVLAVCEIIALYDNRSVTYTISFDSKMKLAGLYMK